MLLGAIADDFTGATDLANTLSKAGMAVVQAIGVPEGTAPAADAIVVALKSRTIPASEAIEQSLAACRWLRAAGARQIFFKYCSTFDSTDAGNIGPVAEALLDELDSDFTVFCPAFPENGRTIYLGHLFVGGDLLSDSGMRDHPLTPMRDANLVRVLSRQTRRKVGLVPWNEVRQGAGALSAAFARLRAQGASHAIVDALDEADLKALGEASAALPLVTGGSGAAMGLPENFRRAGLLPERQAASKLAPAGGHAAVLSGSCSRATLAQVAAMAAMHPARALDPLELARDGVVGTVHGLVAWAKPLLAAGPVLIHASAPPETVAAAQEKLGRDRASALVEQAMAALARALVGAGVRRLVVAGGETSGAVVSALGIEALEIGPQIAPGVPATLAYGSPRIALVLKSGNFGGPGFFLTALDKLA